MSEKNARQIRKEANQFYGNVNAYARSWTNLQIKKWKFFKRVRLGCRLIFKRRLF